MTLDGEYGHSWPRTPLPWCEEHGIPWEFVRRFGVLGADRVAIEGRRYQPVEHGEPALIVAVRGNIDGDPETDHSLAMVTGGPLLELVAIPLKRFHEWALRRGSVRFIGSVEPQILKPDPVPVWRSPFSWLRHGCVGLALLTQDRCEQADVLRGLDIIAEDEAHGRELRAILEHPFPTPRIFTRKARAAA